MNGVATILHFLRVNTALCCNLINSLKPLHAIRCEPVHVLHKSLGFFFSFHPCIFCQACSPSCGILSRNARDYLVHSSGAWKVVNYLTLCRSEAWEEWLTCTGWEKGQVDFFWPLGPEPANPPLSTPPASH